MKKSNHKQRPHHQDDFQKLKVTSYQPGNASSRLVLAETPQIKKRGNIWIRRFRRFFVAILLLILTLALVIAVWNLRNFSSASKKLFGTGNTFSVLRTTPLNSSNDSRVNILLIGYSADDPGHEGATLTDSIQVLSLNQATNTGYMLSIPRDLYVRIPDYGQAKINEAYQAGEAANFNEPGYAPGGPGLLQKIIDETFEIKIGYYTIINYAAVKSTVDALGGVTVNIQSSDPRGLYDPNFRPQEGGPLKLANGPQHLDGQTALNLTRARGATFGSYGFPQSDFNRTQHQQQVFAAIREKLSWELLLHPQKNGRIFDAVASNIQTNIKISEVIPLYRLLKQVPDSSLKPVNLREFNGVNLLASYTTPYGQSALIPAAGIHDYDQIQKAISTLE